MLLQLLALCARFGKASAEESRTPNLLTVGTSRIPTNVLLLSEAEGSARKVVALERYRMR